MRRIVFAIFLSLLGCSEEAQPPPEATLTISQALSPALVQATSKTGSGSSIAVALSKPQGAGDTLVVAVAWNASSGQVTSITDKLGDSFVLAGSTTSSGFATAPLYYALGIAAGSNTVTVKFSGSEPGGDVRVGEFSGVSAFDGFVGAASSSQSSGNLTTTASGDLLVGSGYVSSNAAAGSGWATAVMSSDANLLEYKLAGAAGAYAATFSAGGFGVYQEAAFKAGSPPDAGPSDATSEEAAAEAASDATSEANSEAATEASSEAAVDSSAEAEAEAEAAVDAAPEAEAGQDAAPDATPDATVDGGPSSCFPLKAVGRYLACQDGTPYFLDGDSPWPLIALLSPNDGNPSSAEQYIADRAANGYNALIAGLLVDLYLDGWTDGYTTDGIPPFTSGGNPNQGSMGSLGGYSNFDFSTPNETYFTRVDAILAIAAKYNITILLDPFDTGLSAGPEGWLVMARAQGTTKMFNYGVYVGNRYKNTPNIIWAHGQDFFTWNDPTDHALALAVARGIASVDSNHLHTIELAQENNSSDDPNFSPPVNLNGSYNYAEQYDLIYQARNAEPRPALTIEAEYEYEAAGGLPHNATAFNVRQQNYWTAFAGASGNLYGNHYTWTMNGTWGYSNWTSFLDSPGALENKYFVSFMASIPWAFMSPDYPQHAVVTAGYGSYNSGNTNLDSGTFVTVLGSADHRTAVAYDVAGASLTVNLGWFASPVEVSWYDPSSGTSTSVGLFTNSGSHVFGIPGNNHDGNRDWVLSMVAQ